MSISKVDCETLNTSFYEVYEIQCHSKIIPSTFYNQSKWLEKL